MCPQETLELVKPRGVKILQTCWVKLVLGIKLTVKHFKCTTHCISGEKTCIFLQSTLIAIIIG